jgi:hypothetical protein
VATQELVIYEIQRFQSSKNMLCNLLGYETKQLGDDHPCVIKNPLHPSPNLKMEAEGSIKL